MEADVCDENSSSTVVNCADNTVTENSSAPSIVGLKEIITDDTDILTQTLVQSDLKPQKVPHSVNGNESDDYYEVISADGSIGEDDVDNNEQINTFRSSNDGTGLAVSHDRRSLGERETRSIDDIPFIPKFEFPPDLSENENETVSNYGILRVNRLISNDIPKPDKNFTIPPPSFTPLDINPSLVPVHSVHAPFLNSKSSDLANIPKDKSVSAESHPSDSGSSCTVPVDEVLRNLPGPSTEKVPVVDWLDENGDPIPGAFDYVKPDEEPSVDVKNSKIEYVFSVREKKDVPIKSSEQHDFVSSDFLINQNVLHKNVAGNVGVPLENRLVPDPSGVVKKVYDDEEKKLYEASKSGAEYKAAVQAVTPSSSMDTSSSVIPGNENPKKLRLPKFRRNRFADIKKEEANPEETSEENPPKTKEEAALESQAVTEILREVQRGAARAKEHGALGWQKCPVPVTNKTFLRNTLVSTLREPYRPPSKRGRFHVGLKGNEDKGQHHRKGENDNESRSSRSSRSRSRSRSRSHTSSYSRSRSRSGSADSESRGRRNNFNWRGGRGSWHGGQNQYYDEAWAAYAAHYGYPWYGPEAMPMFYGHEEWPMDPYAAMYYGNPQAWMDYEAYYGPQNFGPRGMGRGFRGRGRGDRGRGRGGYEGGFQGYNDGFRSPSREHSRSRSRSDISHRLSRDRSQSSSLSERSKGRRRSRSLSHGRSRSRSRSHHRSDDRSVRRGSDEKSRSDAEMNEKKKKKKKKKKKHKKTKKSKHRHKDGDDKATKKDAEESIDIDIEKEKTLIKSDSKMRHDGKQDDSRNDLQMAGDTLNQGKQKQLQKPKNQEKSEKGDTNTHKVGNENDGVSKVNKNEAGSRDNIRRNKKDQATEESSKRNFESLTKDSNESAMKVIKRSKKNKEIDDSRDVKKRKKSSDSQEKPRVSDFSDSKHKENTKKDSDIMAREGRSDSQDSRKRSRSNDHRDKDGRDITERDRRSESRDSRKGSRSNDYRGKDGRDITERDRRSESQNSRKMRSNDHRYKGGRNISSNIMEREKRSESHDRNRKEGHMYSLGKDVTVRERSESCDSRGRIRTQGHKRKLGGDNTDVVLHNRSGGSKRPISDQRAIGSRMIESESFDGRERSKNIDQQNRYGRDVAETDRSESNRKDGHMYKGRDGSPAISERKGSNKSSNSKEFTSKEPTHISKDGRGDNVYTTNSDRKDENYSTKQRNKHAGQIYKERTESSAIIERDKKAINTKDRNRLDTGLKNLQTDQEDEVPNKRIVSIKSNLKDKRHRSASRDNVDTLQTGKIINSDDANRLQQRSVRTDKNESEGENKNKESRNSKEGDNIQTKVKNESQNRMKFDKNVISGREIKGGRLEKHSQKDINGGKELNKRDVDQRCHKNNKEKLRENKQDHERKHLHKKKYEPEKIQYKQIMNYTQLGSENDITVSKKDSAMKDLHPTGEASTSVAVNSSEIFPKKINVTTSENEGVTIASSENKQKGDSKSVKRKKKVIKKRKQGDVGETIVSENLIVEDIGEASTLRNKKLKLSKKLKEKPQQEKSEMNSEVGIE